jgi:hypothetical protein
MHTGAPALAMLGKRPWEATMLGTLARGAFLLILAMMVVAYAVSASKSAPPQPRNEHIIVYWNA